MKNEKQEKARPVDQVKFGSIVAAIWENETPNGKRYNVTFSRLYKDAAENWQSSESFGRDDLLTLAKAADEAHSRIFALSSEA